jgi:hypothetical protein
MREILNQGRLTVTTYFLTSDIKQFEKSQLAHPGEKDQKSTKLSSEICKNMVQYSIVSLYLYDLFHILQLFWLTLDPGNVM